MCEKRLYASFYSLFFFQRVCCQKCWWMNIVYRLLYVHKIKKNKRVLSILTFCLIWNDAFHKHMKKISILNMTSESCTYVWVLAKQYHWAVWIKTYDANTISKKRINTDNGRTVHMQKPFILSYSSFRSFMCEYSSFSLNSTKFLLELLLLRNTKRKSSINFIIFKRQNCHIN